MVKLILSLSLFVFSVTAVPVFNDFVCPADDCLTTGCLYQNPKDCATFWQCTAQGRPTLMPCAPGTEFDENIRVCVRAPSPTCQAQQEPSIAPATSEAPVTTEAATSAAPTTQPEEITSEAPEPTTVVDPEEPETTTAVTEEETTTTESETTTVVAPEEETTTEVQTTAAPEETTPEAETSGKPEATTGAQTTSRPEVTTGAPTSAAPEATSSRPESTPEASNPGFVCPVEDIIGTGCMGPTDCLYPHPEDCNSFIQCTVNADNVSGTPVHMPCAAGLEWNDKKKECDYAGEIGTCSGNQMKHNVQDQIVYWS